MTWAADDILDANPPAPDQAISKLERALRSAQTDLEILAETANELERRPINHIAAFCQLPYGVHVSPGWHRVPTSEHRLFADVSCELCRVDMTPSGDFRLNREGAAPTSHRPLVTLLKIILPVWGIRRQWHDRYLTHAFGAQGNKPVIVPQANSWLGNRPIFLREYEHNLTSRLLREISPILRCFLPAYSVRALAEAPVPQQAYAYMAMIAPGKVTFAGESIPIIRPLLESLAPDRAGAVVQADDLAEAMRNRYRVFSRFEAQVFALERLRLTGEIALALIGSLSLLEWLLNGFIREKGGAKLNLSGALRHSLIGFYSPDEVAFLDSARQARNESVHGAPPQRVPLTKAGARPGTELEGIEAGMTTEDVRRVIVLVFKAFRAINQTGARIVV